MSTSIPTLASVGMHVISVVIGLCITVLCTTTCITSTWQHLRAQALCAICAKDVTGSSSFVASYKDISDQIQTTAPKSLMNSTETVDLYTVDNHVIVHNSRQVFV